PGVDGRQKQFEALRRELVMDELLAVAVSPQDMPTRARAAERLGLDRLNGGFWQGFAPLGISSVWEPSQSRQRCPTRPASPWGSSRQSGTKPLPAVGGPCLCSVERLYASGSPAPARPAHLLAVVLLSVVGQELI